MTFWRAWALLVVIFCIYKQEATIFANVLMGVFILFDYLDQILKAIKEDR